VFFNNKAKDEEIKQLKKRIEELESEKTDESVLLEELNQVLMKFEKGFFGIFVKTNSSSGRLNQIKDNFNKALKSNSLFADRAIQTLIEYGNANFEHKVDTEGLSGKMGSVILGIRALGSSISELIALLDVTSEELHQEMISLSNASSSLASSSNQQAASLEETAAALEEVTSTIISTTDNTSKMAHLSEQVNISVKNGEKLAKDTYESMDKINHEVSLIDEATSIIDQIAFQTNILSLNAAVEAATAGEAGKGFAVVAAEVRNLANRSADAAKEISNIVNKAKQRAEEGKKISESMIEGYDKLNKNIHDQINIIAEVSDASNEQKQAIEQINDAITELDQATQQNASSAAQISSQSKHIESLSEKLVNVVKRTTYIKAAKEQVHDIELMFTLNRLKLDHINFKDTNCKQLDTKKIWTVKTEKECNLGKWIIEQELNGKEYTKTENWAHLKQVHQSVHNGVQKVIEYNANDKVPEMLTTAVEIDKAISDVFWTIQKTKRENNC
jgi:methyl-accepting chemotaxis protein